MKLLIKDNKLSLLLLLAVWVLSIYILNCYDKGMSVLWFNEQRTVFFDYFFMWATKLGEPIIIVIVSGILMYSNWRKGVLLAGSLVLNTIIVQLLKRQVFSGHMRPIYYLKDQLSLIEGLDVHSNFSFPSGHTTGGFTLFFMLVLLIKNQTAKISFMFLGVLVAISRVYLSQHFLEDVFAASVLASFTCLIYYISFSKSKLGFL